MILNRHIQPLDDVTRQSLRRTPRGGVPSNKRVEREDAQAAQSVDLNQSTRGAELATVVAREGSGGLIVDHFKTPVCEVSTETVLTRRRGHISPKHTVTVVKMVPSETVLDAELAALTRRLLALVDEWGGADRGSAGGWEDECCWRCLPTTPQRTPPVPWWWACSCGGGHKTESGSSSGMLSRREVRKDSADKLPL